MVKNFNLFTNENVKNHGRTKILMATMSVLLSIAILIPVFTMLVITGVSMETDAAAPICGLTAHTHGEGCYQLALMCGLDETDGHAHGDDCYASVSKNICGIDECEGHVHGENCYIVEQELVCGLDESEGHAHCDDCFATELEFICELDEVDKHVHTDGCYELVLVCGLDEHEHTAECYPAAVETIIGEPVMAFAESVVGANAPMAMAAGDTQQTTVPPGYIEIYTAQDLDNMRNNLSGNYILMNDIDLSMWGNWEPIGNIKSTVFNGQFDGNSYTINGLNITISNDDPDNEIAAGLFSVNSGTIKNVKLTNTSISVYSVTFALVGGIVGNNEEGNIINCYNSGSVSANNSTRYNVQVGGIAGYNFLGDISKCQNIANVSAMTFANNVDVIAGGIVGSNFRGQLSICCNNGDIVASKGSGSNAGGIAGSTQGLADSPAYIENCYNMGNVSSYGFTGGIAGDNAGFINNCYNVGSISQGTYRGGITAWSWAAYGSSAITNTYCLDRYESAYGTVLTIALMRQENSFFDFDFVNVWAIDSNINQGYPYLQKLSEKTDPAALDFEYTISNGEVIITKYIGVAATVNVPATIENKPVKVIGKSAFSNCTGITEVNLSNCIYLTAIADFAFYNCVNLTTVKLPNSLTSIEACAFYVCEKLKTINIPDNLAYIGQSAFGECINLPNIIFPNSIAFIGLGAFTNCISLTEINLSNCINLTSIDGFLNCSNLTDITLPNSITSIESMAFYCCTSLKNIIIPENVISIGDNAFGFCDELTDITLPNNVKFIGKGAFTDCTKLTTIIIPENVESIGYGAFMHCKNLSTAYFKHSNAYKITSFGNYIFLGTAEEFKIIYPYSAIGFTTPIWNGYPAYPEQAATPTANPPSGEVSNGAQVILSTSTSGATIYYTTNGATPTASSAIYTSPITITGATTIKAIAVKAGMDNSGIAIFTYTIIPPTSRAYTMRVDNYRFSNTESSFGYPYSYNIPLERFKELFSPADAMMWYTYDNPWGGSCFGFSSTDLLFFNSILDLKQYKSDAEFVHDLPAPGNSNNNLTKLFERYQISQRLVPISNDFFYYNNNKINDLVQTVRNFQNNKNNGIVIGVWGLYYGQPNGHAIVPYKVTEGVNGNVTLSIYDNNWPDQERFLYINTLTGAWSYELWTGLTWGSANGSSNFISFASVQTINNAVNQALNGNGVNSMHIFVNSKDADITNKNGISISQIDGAYEMIPLTLKLGDTEGYKNSVYKVPDDLYIIKPPQDNPTAFICSISDGNTVYKITADNTIDSIASGIMNNLFEMNINQITAGEYKLEVFNESAESMIIQANGNGSINIEQTDSQVTLTATPNEGYTFDGWYENNVKIPDAEATYTFAATADRTLEARFDPITSSATHTVTFITNGDTLVLPQTVAHGGKIDVPDAPAKSGYIFMGWYKDAALTAKWDFDNDIVDADTVLYGKWAPLPPMPTTDNLMPTTGIPIPTTGIPPITDAIKVTNIETGNGQANVNFAIISANGKGYTVYISETNNWWEDSFIPYSNVNYNAKGANIKGLTNGKKYYVYIEYNNGKGNISKSAVFEFIPSK